MSERNLHKKPFDEGTDTKLHIYREYVKSWFPVFLHSEYPPSRIQIFDFFAGPGKDISGKVGSPLIALEEAYAAIQKCKVNGKNPVPVYLYLNELSRKKIRQLECNCRESKFSGCVNITYSQKDFPDAFESWYKEMIKPGVANFLFLDQNGVKQVSRDIFRQIVAIPHTDYLFYISSAIVNRFKTDPAVTGPLPVTKNDLTRMNGTNVHHVIKESYQRMLPDGMYIAPFSIKKGANVYGLIYGTSALLGLEKFLTICWDLDEVHGNANFDVEGENINPNAPSLFEEMDKPKKLDIFERELCNRILRKDIKTNRDAYKFSLQNGFLARHARQAIKSMITNAIIPKQKIAIAYDSCIRKSPVEIETGTGA